jgi:hypothetical protein
VTDAERIAARLTPDVLRAVAEHLEGIDRTARSEIVLHHGPDGIARGVECHKRLKTVDVRATGGVPSGT